MLMTRMPKRSLLAIVQSIARMTSDTYPVPSAERTLRLISIAPGAMPTVDVPAEVVSPAPLPAMMLATCVPWPYKSRVPSPVKSI